MVACFIQFAINHQVIDGPICDTRVYPENRAFRRGEGCNFVLLQETNFPAHTVLGMARGWCKPRSVLFLLVCFPRLRAVPNGHTSDSIFIENSGH